MGWTLAILALCGPWPTTAARAADQHLVDEVQALIETHFFRPSASNEIFAVDAARSASRPPPDTPTRATGPTADVGERITQALSALQASHTGRYTPDTIDYFELLDTYKLPTIAADLDRLFPDGVVHYDGIGLVPQHIDSQTFVAYVYDGSPADAAGILPGDEILSIDDAPYAAIGSFAGKAGNQVTVQLRRTRDAAPLTRTVTVEAVRPGDMLVDAIRASARVILHDGVKVGYVRVWTFAHPDVGPLLNELLTTGPLASAQTLILDLRGRWGGAPPDAGEMFVGRTAELTLIGRNGDVIPVNVRWRKPLVALIDKGTRSGMEVLAYSLQKAGIPLIGSNTAGAVLGGRPFILSDDSLLLIAVMDVLVDGRRLEGTGVAPDIPVSQTLPYAAGQDRPLARALDEAAQRARP